jgi:hypothetical protein
MAQGDDSVGSVSPESGDAVLVTATVFEFNRRESPTQTRADAIKQGVSMEIWGLPAQYSIIASVKAYRELKCPLASFGPRGIMFDTNVAPTPGCGSPFEARWNDGSPGVVRRPGGYVAIPISKFLNLQP